MDVLPAADNGLGAAAAAIYDDICAALDAAVARAASSRRVREVDIGHRPGPEYEIKPAESSWKKQNMKEFPLN